MRDHTLYWLREVSYWCPAILAADLGMAWGHLPAVTAASLLKRRLIERTKAQRFILTPAGKELIA